MKQVLKGLFVLSLFPGSSAFADISCLDGLHSLHLQDQDPSAVEARLGIGRGAMNFSGALKPAEKLEVLGQQIYALTSEQGVPAILTVSTSLPHLSTFGCGRRICWPEDDQPAQTPNESANITAVLEIGAEKKSSYEFKQCEKIGQ